jgi:hypothetical protein
MTNFPDTLEAGRILDALVAHEVMGWGDGIVEMAKEGKLDPYPDPEINGEFCVAGPPQYSTDPAAMMQVVEKMAHLWNIVSLELTDDSRGKVWSCGIGDFSGRAFGAKAHTAPLAVCRAALLAVAQEVKL